MVNENYSKKFDLCKNKFGNYAEMKRHIKSHSYKEEYCRKVKCQDCDFVGQRHEGMDVYMAKCHTDNFEWGLCERSNENINSLQTH